MITLFILVNQKDNVEIKSEYLPPNSQYVLLKIDKDLEDIDVYITAKKLAEMLLEKIS